MSEVKATTDYGIFKTVTGNREVNVQHVNRLARTIKEHNLTEKFPIVVNSAMEVIDGQHRLAALEKLELPVYYRVEDNVPVEDIRILNQVTRSWTWRDLAKSYVEMGNDSYQVILDLNEERPGLYNMETLLQIANVSIARSNTRPLSNYFFGGGMQLDEEQRKDLTKIAHWIGDFTDTQPHFKSRAMSKTRELPRPYAGALIRVMKGETYDHREFMQRISTSHIELPEVLDTNEALREIEKAYNKNLTEANRVRLF